MTTLALQKVKERKAELQRALAAAEKQVYELETNYLSDAVQNGHGNVFKGFEGFLSHWKGSGGKRVRTFKPEDRLFSLSSTTSPAAAEIPLENEVATGNIAAAVNTRK